MSVPFAPDDALFLVCRPHDRNQRRYSGVTNRPAGLVDQIFCFVALSFFIGAYLTLPYQFQGIGAKGGESNPFTVAATGALLVATAAMIAARLRPWVFVARHGGMVNWFLLLALVSVLWSDAPELSFRKWIALAVSIAFAYYAVAVLSVVGFIRILAAAIGVSLVASVLLATLLPKVGISTEGAIEGAWIGAYGHKSQIGMACVIGVLCFGWLWRLDRRWYDAFFVLLCIIVAVMARSRTAQMAILLIVSFSMFLPLLRLPNIIRFWAILGLLAISLTFATIGILFFGEIMDALGKDASLTGRLPTWAGLVELAIKRPFGGYGYSAFFVERNTDMQNVWREAGWPMWSAHSGYIEVMLSLGIPGLVLVMAIVLEIIYRCSIALVEGDLPWASFTLVYMVTHLAVNAIDSSAMLRSGEIVSLLSVVLLVGLRLRSAARKAAAQSVSIRPGRPQHPSYKDHWRPTPQE